MRIQGKNTQSIIEDAQNASVSILDQTKLPYQIHWLHLNTLEQVAYAIKEMQVRGAPLIGALAAYGLSFAMRHDASDEHLLVAYEMLSKTRPTAVNLFWALNRCLKAIQQVHPSQRFAVAWNEACNIKAQDVLINQNIGKYGLGALEEIIAAKSDPSVLNILTHCNAGWLATLDYGTATAPIYMAHDAKIPVHVYVDETRPRNQGALTAFELAEHGVPHTVIVDNAGGQLMLNKKIDVVIVGCDRVAANGDACNKIGTYLKALAAYDNNIPFFVALPSPTFDANLASGQDIPIEERNPDEVRFCQGLNRAGDIQSVQIYPTKSQISNLAFDVTPARLITGYITEKGILKAQDLKNLRPE